tara:strand:- start:78 stop:488 length:411 start_codon:yes stop_codon:yes gene_type:complete
MSDNERIIKFILDIANCYELSPQDYNEAKLLLDKYGSMTCDKQEAEEVKEDLVNNPKHYMLFADGTESFDVIRKALTPEEYIGGLKFNILKYRLRMGKKKGAVDCLKKAQWYEDKLVECVEFLESSKVGRVEVCND